MTLPENGKLLRIFIGENDRHEKMPPVSYTHLRAHETF